MIRDSFYRDIVRGLGGRLDPEAFERCAADLLRAIYPGLVPVRGGSDAGMDGAIADQKGPPLPLVSTTSENVTRNLRGSLRSYVESGGRRREAVFATSRGLSPPRRANLSRVAEEEGFTLIQVHDQAAFADLLRRSPAWCRELLNLTGQPSALSPVPLTSRPMVSEVMVARDPDLTWLSGRTSDALLVGQPGSGKTFILQALAREGRGLFVVSDDRNDIAACIREESPEILFVDDAHRRQDLLLSLQHLRASIGAGFRILATCWPGDKLGIMKAMSLGRSDVRELDLLTRREIANVVRAAGITGPTRLVREIIDQSKGLPGLAVTLAVICRRDGVRELASGAALFEDVQNTFQQLVGREAIEILAGFALGGERGMLIQDLSQGLGVPAYVLRDKVENLASGGVLSDENGSLVVQPEALRHALVGEVYFSGAAPLPVQGVLDRVPDPAASALTLIGAKHRGFRVPDTLIRTLLVGAKDDAIWAAYASLGRGEVEWLLSVRDEFDARVTYAALTSAADLVLPRLLARAVGDLRPLRSSLDHPLRIVQDWVKEPPPGRGDAVTRRRAVLDAVLRWHADGGADPGVSLRALALAFEPAFEDQESDPVDGMMLTLRFGGLTVAEIDGIISQWPDALRLIRACGAVEWECLRHLIRDWAYPAVSTHGHIAPESHDQMRAFAERMMKDIAAAGEPDPAAASWMASLANRMGWEAPCRVDPVYQVLFPEDEDDDLHESFRRQISGARGLADAWAADPPHEVAERLARYSAVAATAGHRWPLMADHVAGRLSEISTDPLDWVQALLDVNAAAALVGPFLRRALRENLPGSEEHWERCVEVPLLRPMAVLMALTEPDTPERVLERALASADGLGDLVSWKIVRGEVPEQRLPALLGHPDPSVREHTARAIWDQDPEGEVPASVAEPWRGVVVEHLERTTTLTAIFATHPAIAFDWLVRRVGRMNRRSPGADDGPYEVAVDLMTREQREQLIGMLTPDTWPREIVRHLVGNDVALYRRLLERPDLTRLHLEPLEGEPDPSWVSLAKMARNAGHSAAEVAHATRGSMWGWEGKESDMWSRWVEAFRPLAASADPEAREIGEAGMEDVQYYLERARKAERREAIYGLR